MSEINYGNIGEIGKFIPEDYPKMVTELTTIIKDLDHISIYFKRDIIISYLKDHSLKTEWIAANPDLVNIMTSGKLSTTHLEKLFEACRWNKPFRSDLERYLKARLN